MLSDYLQCFFLQALDWNWTASAPTRCFLLPNFLMNFFNLRHSMDKEHNFINLLPTGAHMILKKALSRQNINECAVFSHTIVYNRKQQKILMSRSILWALKWFGLTKIVDQLPLRSATKTGLNPRFAVEITWVKISVIFCVCTLADERVTWDPNLVRRLA